MLLCVYICVIVCMYGLCTGQAHFHESLGLGRIIMCTSITGFPHIDVKLVGHNVTVLCNSASCTRKCKVLIIISTYR